MRARPVAVVPVALALVLAACSTPSGPSATTHTSASESAPASPVPGAGTAPGPVAVTVDAATTAYLVLDITNTICQPRKSCVASLPAIAALLKKARDAKALVVYSDTGGTSQILPDVAAQAGEPKVSGRADKFFGTDLDGILKQRGIQTAVIVGTVANGAVLYTAFGANVRGYTVVVAEDGMSSEDPYVIQYTRYQLLNEPGFANADNKPLDKGHVTLSRSDLVTFR